MANIFGLQFDTKEERERKSKAYAARIFPFGDPQKEKVARLLMSLFPGFHKQELLLDYILIKDKMTGVEKMDFDSAVRAVQKQAPIPITPKISDGMKRLLKADLWIDEQLEYPAVEELKALKEQETPNRGGAHPLFQLK